MPQRSVVIVTSRRRPHELLLLAYSTILGCGYLAGVPVPASVAQVLPEPAVTVWAGLLVVSGTAGLIGAWRHDERGMGVEVGAMVMGAGALLVYAVAVFVAAGWRALLPGGLVAAWAAANLWRAAQARADIRAMRGGDR